MYCAVTLHILSRSTYDYIYSNNGNISEKIFIRYNFIRRNYYNYNKLKSKKKLNYVRDLYIATKLVLLPWFGQQNKQNIFEYKHHFDILYDNVVTSYKEMILP